MADVHVIFNNPTVKRAEHFVELVGAGDWLGCILIGPAGMGKTHTVEWVLRNMGLVEGDDFCKFGGHISLAGTYEMLYQYRDKIIFFDDVSQVVNQAEIMELLKQALNSGGGKRILSYRSKRVLNKDVPSEFEFTGRCIFAFNCMDKNNANVKAIVSRAPMVELKYNRADLLSAMYQIAEAEGGGLMVHEKLIVTKHIEDITDITMDADLRKQSYAFKEYSFNKRVNGEGDDGWKANVQMLFGKKKRHWVASAVEDLVGDKTIKRSVLAVELARLKECNVRTAQRRIADALEMGDIYRNKLKGEDISIKPFVGGC